MEQNDTQNELLLFEKPSFIDIIMLQEYTDVTNYNNIYYDVEEHHKIAS